jgi:hypothetical protein
VNGPTLGMTGNGRCWPVAEILRRESSALQTAPLPQDDKPSAAEAACFLPDLVGEVVGAFDVEGRLATRRVAGVGVAGEVTGAAWD